MISWWNIDLESNNFCRHAIKCWLTLSRISPKARSSIIDQDVDVDRSSIEGINCHSNANAFSTCDPDIQGLFCHKVLRECSPYPFVDTIGTRILTLWNPFITTETCPDFCGPLVTELTGFQVWQYPHVNNQWIASLNMFRDTIMAIPVWTIHHIQVKAGISSGGQLVLTGRQSYLNWTSIIRKTLL